MKDVPTFHGFTYSAETSDDDDPNEAYYYAGQFITQQNISTFPYIANYCKLQ